MAVEMNKTASIRLTPVQEIKLAKPATELYVGQILKTVVVTALTNNQVLININGQNINAKTSHHFTPGELLEVKVVANHDETILEVQQKAPSLTVLQNALLQALPKQAPPTNLLQTLTQLLDADNLPPALSQQIRILLSTITPLSQLPQQLMQAVNQSGIFLESSLLEWQKGLNSRTLRADFKGQCLKLLNTLPFSNNSSRLGTELESKLLVKQDPLPLPGAIPQPLQRNTLLSLLDSSPDEIQQILREQVTQVLARITASQINHLTHDNKEGFFIMLDLPIKTSERIDVIPLMIKQHRAEPMQPSKWSISFALSLSELGDMQGTVSLHANNINIKINAQNAATIKTIEAHREEIGLLLAESGFTLQDIKLQLGLENNHIDVANLRLLDIRI